MMTPDHLRYQAASCRAWAAKLRKEAGGRVSSESRVEALEAARQWDEMARQWDEKAAKCDV